MANSPTKRANIVVLHHQRQPTNTEDYFLISWMAKRWREWGHEVRHLYGVNEFADADLAILHVDLSVITKDYADFASRYPKTVNLGLLDIRKSQISHNLVQSGDGYAGPVIVKTDLNHGGTPELLLGIQKRREPSLASRIKRRLGLKDPLHMRGPADYVVYKSPSHVPRKVFGEPSLVVERFLPEGREGNYYHRRYLFFGDAEWNEVWSGTESINFADNAQLRTSVEPPPDEVRQWRNAAKADYGKLDYVIHNGRVEVFDVNRTPSGSLLDKDPRDARWAQEVTDALAMGIHTYLS